jgi:hypothetical protein
VDDPDREADGGTVVAALQRTVPEGQPRVLQPFDADIGMGHTQITGGL